MGILWTGGVGRTLKDILDELENRDFENIMVRCLWKYSDGEENDDLIGYCSYINGRLIPQDGDSYSLDDLYVKYEINNDMLIVWEFGELE